ncbi:MAG TPA: transketolase, partial [Burkholderiaceae bacterium]|nr:transketolase [Burkholderiaceae bacterium]
LLHLTGYDLPMQELRNFRQLHSKTAGHPEVHITPGVETTTGPLGQGITNAVGMALAEWLLASEFNRPGHEIVDHNTWVFLGDGCLMEGISHEACSLAGALQLRKLIAFWDDNGISIDGKVEGWFRDDTPMRFEAYGWNVIRDVDGHDVEAIDVAIVEAKQSDRPTLICCKTIIGKGAPTRAGSAKAHGEALGAAEIAATREALGWTLPPFEIPNEVYEYANATRYGARAEAEWNESFAKYREEYPNEAAEFLRRMQGYLPADWAKTVADYIAQCEAKAEGPATRKASQNAIEAYAKVLPEFLGGSADLTGSNLTQWSTAKPVRANQPGQHINYGVREFGMSAVVNGIALHGGFIPFAGTFLTFSDYARNALRMAALMKCPGIFVYTHDSIGLGEDGPTHQAVEHAASLRLIPNMHVWRPADTTETAVAWACAVERKDGPACLLFSRQAVPHLPKVKNADALIRRGAYVLSDAADARLAIIATGSEVHLALAAQKVLAKEGIATRVVSMPSTTVFDRQDSEYKRHVLPDAMPRIAVEAGVTDFWWKYKCDAVVGIDRFGESAPAGVLYEYFGFTPENIARTVRDVLALRG